MLRVFLTKILLLKLGVHIFFIRYAVKS